MQTTRQRLSYRYKHLSYLRLNHLRLKKFSIGAIAAFSIVFTASVYSGSQTDPALEPYDLSYAATYNGMDIDANRQLKQESGRYTLTTTAKNMLSNITERGEFQVNDQGVIIDLDYQYKRSILGMKKTENLTYNRKTGVANYDSKKKQRQVTLADGYLNRLTYQLQLQRDLINGVSPLQYQVISRGRLKSYNFEVMGEEILDTPLGKINTTKVKRIRKDNDRETMLWLAPKWNYLLVQLWQREKGGGDYKIVLQQGTLNGDALSN
ncbi:MAG: hypothetical protein COA46_07575 [Porticoccaceae bacterium]|nr:MAG: hypothetical protein COA46_07575 [Porticoccaceae bacterium]